MPSLRSLWGEYTSSLGGPVVTVLLIFGGIASSFYRHDAGGLWVPLLGVISCAIFALVKVSRRNAPARASTTIYVPLKVATGLRRTELLVYGAILLLGVAALVGFDKYQSYTLPVTDKPSVAFTGGPIFGEMIDPDGLYQFEKKVGVVQNVTIDKESSQIYFGFVSNAIDFNPEKSVTYRDYILQCHANGWGGSRNGPGTPFTERHFYGVACEITGGNRNNSVQ